MPRHDAVAACVDEQLVGGNALLVQAVDLAEDSLRIDNNTRADDVDALRIQDAGRNQLQLVLLTAGYNGVTGIVAALAADNQIRLACENINKLTLAFVAPLSAENYLTWHRISSLSICNVLLSRSILIIGNSHTLKIIAYPFLLFNAVLHVFVL